MGWAFPAGQVNATGIERRVRVLIIVTSIILAFAALFGIVLCSVIRSGRCHSYLIL